LGTGISMRQRRQAQTTQSHRILSPSRFVYRRSWLSQSRYSPPADFMSIGKGDPEPAFFQLNYRSRLRGMLLLEANKKKYHSQKDVSQVPMQLLWAASPPIGNANSLTKSFLHSSANPYWPSTVSGSSWSLRLNSGSCWIRSTISRAFARASSKDGLISLTLRSSFIHPVRLSFPPSCTALRSYVSNISSRRRRWRPSRDFAL
jgi:hypothetical protein